MLGAMIAGVDFSDPTVIGAIVAAFGYAIVKLVPKTRTEAAVDWATAREKDAASWGALVTKLESTVERLTGELEEERARGNRLEARGDRLEARIAELEAA